MADLDELDLGPRYSGSYDGSVFGGVYGGVYGGDESSGWFGWIIFGIVLILVWLVIWRMSDFRKDRVCISTDLRDYVPSGQFGLPVIPGVDSLPALSHFLPSEQLATPVINRSRGDEWYVARAYGK